MSNAEIADRLASLAQLMAAGKENPYKVKAYRRAAARLRTFSESLDELVHEEADLTVVPDVGNAIAACIREIVLTGTLTKLVKLRDEASAELASISEYPRLDPKRVLRVYEKLGIAAQAGVRIAISTDAHSTREFGLIRYGLDQARRAGLSKSDILNCLPWRKLCGLMKR